MADETEIKSEYAVPVVRVREFQEIPGADQIRVAYVGLDVGPRWDYPVVVRKDAFNVGDRAVYIPVNSVLPDEPEFAFLGSDRRRLRAKRLRGVYSEGLLITSREAARVTQRRARVAVELTDEERARLADRDAEDCADAAEGALFEIPLGTDIRNVLGVEEYVGQTHDANGVRLPGGKRAPDESWAPVYSVSNAKKGEGIDALPTDATVLVTEKIHGMNVRFGLFSTPDGEPVFRLGSHRSTRLREPDGADPFNRVCREFRFQEGLGDAGLLDLVVYGEVYGRGIQDLEYGLGGLGFRVYDVWNAKTKTWLPFGEVIEVCRQAGFDHVPILWRGPYGECDYRSMAEGETCLNGATHVREGVVIREWARSGVNHRWKYVGTGYRLRKGEQKERDE